MKLILYYLLDTLLPNYWWTSERIAKKYGLIKPIPFTIKDNSYWDNYGVYYLNMCDDDVSDFDDAVIEHIEANLDKFIDKGYVRKIDSKDQIYVQSL